jgi:hypothetical protein
MVSHINGAVIKRENTRDSAAMELAQGLTEGPLCYPRGFTMWQGGFLWSLLAELAVVDSGIAHRSKWFTVEPPCVVTRAYGCAIHGMILSTSFALACS